MFSLKFLGIVLGAMIFCNSLKAENFEFKAEGKNISQEYEKTDLSDQGLAELLQNYHIIIIPGFLSNPICGLDHLRKEKRCRYFGDLMDYLTELKIPFTYVETESEASPAFNVKFILKAMEDDKKYLVVTHSKGGLDFLQTLIENPELVKKAPVWLSFNSPFQGTPLANEVAKYRAVRWVAVQILHLLGGTEKGLQQFLVEERQKFLLAHQDEIQKLLKQMKMASVAARRDDIPGEADTVHEWIRDYLASQGYQTDGIVPWQSQILPGSNYVYIEKVDHQATVMKTPYCDMDRRRLFRNLVGISFAQ